MIKLFTIHCARCKVLELKLKQKQVDFETVDDEGTVVAVGKEHGIMQAPILQVNDQFLDFAAAVKYVNEVK